MSAIMLTLCYSERGLRDEEVLLCPSLQFSVMKRNAPNLLGGR